MAATATLPSGAPHDDVHVPMTLQAVAAALAPPSRPPPARRLRLPVDAEFAARMPGRRRLACVVESALGRADAAAVTSATEAAGYAPATFGGKTVYQLRNSARCIAECPEFSAALLARVRHAVPVSWRDESGRVWRLRGVADRLRFLKYGPGMFFKPHRDGAQGTATTRSFITIMLYLTDAAPPGFVAADFDHDGGRLGFLPTHDTRLPAATPVSPHAAGGGAGAGPASASAFASASASAFASAFAFASASASASDASAVSPGGGGAFPADSPHRISFTPRAGDVVLFEHGCLHEGEPVYSGTKYAMRTDVLYDLVAMADGSPPPPASDSDAVEWQHRLAPDGFVALPLPPSSYVSFALATERGTGASDTAAATPPAPAALPLVRVPSVPTLVTLTGESYYDGSTVSLGSDVQAPTRLDDVLAAVSGAGKPDVNGLYVMYEKGGKIKTYAGRPMWKGLASALAPRPAPHLRAGESADGRSPYMLFYDGMKWWIGFGLFRCDGDFPGAADGWQDHFKTPLPAGTVTIRPAITAASTPGTVTITCPCASACGDYTFDGTHENGRPRYEAGNGWFLCFSGRSWWLSRDDYVNDTDAVGAGKPPCSGWAPYPTSSTDKLPPPALLLCTIANRGDLEVLKSDPSLLAGSPA